MPSMGRVSSRGGHVVRHTPWEYTRRPRVRDSGCDRSRRRPPQHPRSVGSVLRRRDGPRRGRRRLADDRGGVPTPTGAPSRRSDRAGRRGRRGRPAARHLAAATAALESAPGRRPGRWIGDASTCRDRPAWDRHVLGEVARIPCGSTASYGDIARRVGAPRAARAVGGAVGRNPIGLLIPCHRVIAADGTIGGYGGDAWGSREDRLEIKRALLAREGVEIEAG